MLGIRASRNTLSQRQLLFFIDVTEQDIKKIDSDIKRMLQSSLL